MLEPAEVHQPGLDRRLDVLERPLRPDQLAPQHLERHDLVELVVVRAVDGPRAAAADEPEDAVAVGDELDGHRARLGRGAAVRRRHHRRVLGVRGPGVAGVGTGRAGSSLSLRALRAAWVEAT